LRPGGGFNKHPYALVIRPALTDLAHEKRLVERALSPSQVVGHLQLSPGPFGFRHHPPLHSITVEGRSLFVP